MPSNEIAIIQQNAEQQKLLFRRAQTVTSNLMHQLKIPEGNQLVFALKQGRALSNREAITSWLLPLMGDSSISDERYNELRKRLLIKLDDFGSDECL